MARRPRIAQLLPHAFHPPTDGGRVKSASLASALARHGDLHLFSLEDATPGGGGTDTDEPLDLPYGGSAVLHRLRAASDRVRAPRCWLLQVASARSTGLPLGLAPASPRKKALLERIRRGAFDLVVADDTRFAALAVGSGRPAVVHTHNLESALWEELAATDPSGAAAKLREARRARRQEEWAFPRALQVWGVRGSDLAAYRARGVAEEACALVPNVAPPDWFLPPSGPGEPLRGLCFGALNYLPNQEAARRCAELVRGIPDARIRIAGGSAPAAFAAELDALPGLDRLGFVEDLDAELRAAAAVLAPLPGGGGTKLKVLQALAAARPLVTTPAGAEGLDLEDGGQALIRPWGPGFVEAAQAVLRDPAAYQDMARRGQAHVRTRFSLEALCAAVDGALARLDLVPSLS